MKAEKPESLLLSCAIEKNKRLLIWQAPYFAPIRLISHTLCV